MQSPLSLFWFPLAVFAVTVLLHLAALRMFPRVGLLDFPKRYGLSRSRIPYPTGIIAVFAFLVAFTVIIERKFAWSSQALGLFWGVILLAIVSFIDDRRPLPAKLRLIVQAAVGLLIFLSGTRIYSLTNPLSGFLGGPVLSLDTFVVPSVLFQNPSVIGAVFTMLWLGLTMNALNWFDGVRGQTTALSAIGFLTIGFLSLSARVNDPDLALLAFTCAGVALASFVVDFPPPLSLLGDTGSMFFGLLLGVLTIFAGGKVATGFLVLGVPLIDTFFVIVRRIRKGVSPFQGNTENEHLHHRLLRRGWSERRITLFTSGIGTLFGVSALFLSTFQKFLSALALFLLMLLFELVFPPTSHRKSSSES